MTRFYYVLALSKSEPTYSVQKKLYEIGNSKINDEAKKYARYQAVYLRHNLLIGVENNYIFNAVAGNDIIRWDINSFPLKIYYKNVESVPAYYHENIDKALSQWTERTNFVKFVQAKDEKMQISLLNLAIFLIIPVKVKIANLQLHTLIL